MSDDLKECPFCGCRPTLKVVGDAFMIKCSGQGSCEGSGLMNGFTKQHQETAIARWNARPTAAPDEKLADELVREFAEQILAADFHDEAVRIIADLSSRFRRPQPSAWRPIAEAPKDGQILIVAKFCKDELIWVKHSRWMSAEEAAEVEGGNADDYEAGWTNGDDDYENCYPTHFMTITTPPEDEATQE